MKQAKRIAVLIILTAGPFFILGCLWYLRFSINARAPARLAINEAQGAASVQRMIGEPLHSSRFIRGILLSKDGYGNADLTIPVSGSHGHGTLFEWAQEDKGKWHICSLILRPTDAVIATEIVSDTATHCERE
jgi:hypothetical protein